MTTSPEVLKALPQLRKMAYDHLGQLAEALHELAHLAEACADPALATEDLFRRPEVHDLELKFEPEAVGAVDELIESVDVRWELLDAATDEVSTLFRATAQSLDVLKQLLVQGLPALPEAEEDECDCDDDGCDCGGHHRH